MPAESKKYTVFCLRFDGCSIYQNNCHVNGVDIQHDSIFLRLDDSSFLLLLSKWGEKGVLSVNALVALGFVVCSVFKSQFFFKFQITPKLTGTNT